MSKSRHNGKIEFIEGFSDLFETDKQGIRHGATLLISGPPGAGKTTFALALIRALMAEFEADENSKKTATKAIAYYISSEVDETVLRENYSSFGWFKPTASATTDETTKIQASADTEPGFAFTIDDPQPDETNFYVITPIPETDRPVPSPEELVNRIFNRIAHTLSPSEAPKEPARIYVVIDSISALLKACTSAAEERRQTHEILFRLRDRFGPNNPAFTVLLAEQDFPNHIEGERNEPPSLVEDYLAEIVFRLYTRSLPLGRRSRSLEVVKSQGVNMILGEHTWQIITNENYTRILRHVEMQKSIKYAYGYSVSPSVAREQVTDKKTFEGTDWAGIIIFPRPRRRRIAGGQDRLDSGTIGLEMKFRKGSTTLIAGPLGSGKTTLCKQFLKRAAEQETKNKPVLFSFDILPKSEASTEFEVLDFTQWRFDVNVLAAHIRWILAKNPPIAIAFDGLHEWVSVFESGQALRMLEVLMIALRRSDDPPAVLMTYTTGLFDDPAAPPEIGMNAENILIVRQVSINDRLRRIIYALKQETEPAVLEVPQELVQVPAHNKKGHERIEVVTGTLDFYRGLIEKGGRLGQARVFLALFAENDSEGKFNEALHRTLSKQHKGRLEVTFSRFSQSEIGSTFDVAADDKSPGESASVKIQSVDEWWSCDSGAGKFLTDLRHIWKGSTSTNWHDYWKFEVEKATAGAGEKSPIYAVPAYIDFGMLFINLSACSTGESRSSSMDRARWRKLLSEVPRVWAAPVKKNGRNWFVAEPQTVLGYALEKTGQRALPHSEREPVFAFDSNTRESCVCAFLELAWAFGAPEGIFTVAEESRLYGIRALTFLQFMVVEGLMADNPSLEGSNTLFVRHFYSTFVDACEKNQGAELIALPFMPTGLQRDFECLIHAISDIKTRARFWVERAEAAAIDPADKDVIRQIESWSKNAEHGSEAEVLFQGVVTNYEKCRELVINWATNPPSTVSEKWRGALDDLIELVGWAAFRLQLLAGSHSGTFPEGKEERIAKALESIRSQSRHLPDLRNLKFGGFEKAIFTGYGCTGSWMYGVSKQSRAPGLQSQILREITSLECAEKRAAGMAGMPSRKDFFYLHGGNNVPGLPYLNWREFLRLNGARARRRDRIMPAPSDLNKIYKVIHMEVLGCLRAASLCKADYAEAGNDKTKDQLIERLFQYSKASAERIFALNKNES